VWGDEALYLRAAGMAKSATLWAAEHGVVAVGADILPLLGFFLK
jgi:hypothetical protein